jgi:N-acetylglucosaminyl-diphospho-decaprenol L-rhamnosyltransferase
LISLPDHIRRENNHEVSVVIVAFGSEDVIEGAIESLPDSVEVIVVEQRADGAAAAAAVRARPSVKVVYAGANRGFGAGCNLGAANAQGDTLLFLNPDARIDGPSIELLAERVRATGGAMVGPTIYDGDGSPSTRVRLWSTPARIWASVFVPHRLLPDTLRAEVPPGRSVYSQGGPVAFVQGSCFAVGREAFFAAGGFNELFFLYGEEEWLARQLERHGLSAFLEPAAIARHVGGTSTDKVGGFATEQWHRSLAIHYRLTYGAARATGAGAAYLLTLAIFWLTAPLRELVSFREREDADWCRHAAIGLIQGMMRRPPAPPQASLIGEAWPAAHSGRSAVAHAEGPSGR